ncbi:MAG: PRC-barrel domain-containing protein [Pseudomonadota bacterium]
MFRAAALAAALAFGMAATPVAAQDVPAGVFFKKQNANQYLARDLLLGAKVYGPDNKIIGDIEDLIMNDSNRVVGVIMGVGGFLGVGEKRVGVRYAALSVEFDGGKARVSLPEASQAVLKSVPKFERAQPKKSLYERALEKARELRDKTGQTSKDAYNKAKETAGPAYEKAKDAASKAYEKTKEAAGQAYEKTKDAAGKAVERARETAGGAGEEKPSTQ